MTENVKKFLEKLSENEVLAKELRSATAEQVKAQAKALGFDLTEEDFAASEGEIAEDELDTVAGGKACACVVGGGGEKSLADLVCWCVAGGSGNGEWDSGAQFLRCACVVIGGGD